MATRPTEVTQSPETGDTVEECTGKQLFSECIADLEDLFSSVSQSCSDLFCSVVFFWSFFCSVKKNLCVFVSCQYYGKDVLVCNTGVTYPVGRHSF